jgi:hypothetical protein
MAAGHFHKGCDSIADVLSKQTNKILVSHGMPKSTIKYDSQDKSVITEYESHEISPLPEWVAANVLTGFIAINKEADMALNDEKRRTLIEELGFSEEALSQIESKNQSDNTAAKELGLERKEKTDAVGEVKEETSPVEETKPEEKPENTEDKTEEKPENTDGKTDESEGEIKEQPTSRKEIADAIMAVFGPKFDEVSTALKQVGERVDKIEKSVVEISVSDEEKIKQNASFTPNASLFALLRQSVIGNEAAKVGTGDKSLDTKPKENENKGDDIPAVGIARIPFIHDIMVAESQKE